MKTTVSDNSIQYTMSLERTDSHYELTFTSQNRLFPRTEAHVFEDFTTAWEHYSNNCHYYNNVRPEPLSEEAFLGLKPGTLYGGMYA